MRPTLCGQPGGNSLIRKHTSIPPQLCTVLSSATTSSCRNRGSQDDESALYSYGPSVPEAFRLALYV